MKLFDLKQQHEASLAKAESFIAAAETAGRAMTASEVENSTNAMNEAKGFSAQIKVVEDLNTIRAMAPKGRVIADASQEQGTRAEGTFSKEYASDFGKWARSKGLVAGSALTEGADDLGGFKFPSRMSASGLYTGNNAAGGFAVPVTVDPQIVALAPPEFGVQKLALVIPTTNDVKFPVKSAHGAAAAKAEGTGSGLNVFTGTNPALSQFTLSAFMVGHPEDASWELLQDVNGFQAFVQDDILLSIAILKENVFVNGSGIGQAQGLIGNTAPGITGVVADASGNKLPISATFDVLGALNAVYHQGASWLMQRATSISLRKAQVQANLFEPVFVRQGATDYLHGYPVEYTSAMPGVATGSTPVLFGDFKRGYIIGERGGAGVNVKILDQPKALEGLVTILGYQRVDGRVRRSEAIEAITLA